MLGQRMHTVRSLCIVLLVTACGGAELVPASTPNPALSVAPARAPTPPPASASADELPPERLDRNTQRTLPSGAMFTAPAGWTIKTRDQARILEGTDPRLSIAIVEAQGDRADDAMSAAWSAFRAQHAYPLKLAQDGPRRNGWDALRNYEYEVGAGTLVRAFAQSFRKGDVLTMVLVHADLSVYERSRGKVNVVLDSLRPPGFEPESFRGKVANPLEPARVRRITEFVDRHRQAAGIPGVALALVEKDKIVFEGGFGVREIGKAAKVGAETLFMIGSCSKSLTTLLLAKLVDEGKFDWETPVTSVYPAFKLGDATTTSQVRMKHLVCACTGLPRDGFEAMLEYGRMTAKTKLDVVGQMRPTSKIGEAYQYSNILAAVAGFIGGHAAYPTRELGVAYDEAIRTRIFEPLAMKRTTVDIDRARRLEHANPHSENFEGQPSPVTIDINRAVTTERPSGAIWSSAHDMAAYLRMELALGMLPDGRRYLSKENLLARHTPQIASGEDTAYGMGLILETLNGVKIAQHGGATFGYRAFFYLFPEHGVGAVILTNADSGTVFGRPLLRKMLEELFDGNDEASDDIGARVEQRRTRLKKYRERSSFPADAAASAKLARRYNHAKLGELAVVVNKQGTVFDFGEWKTAVASSKLESGAISFRPAEPGMPDFMEFTADEREGKRVLVVRDLEGEQVFVEK
jgi:CubicO group peptidase (beta-lactamase class C family)